jgi:Leucine-rich repeat (LRR) protein
MRLTGKIVRSITLLKRLEVLDLSNNGFFGTIPNSIGNLPKLTKLILRRNYLQGKKRDFVRGSRLS